MTEITLREFRGTLSECQLIVGWRNDPQNAKAFPKQEPWRTHSQFDWYNEVYRSDPSLNLYWVYADGQPVGTVGMQIRGGMGELMWIMLGNKSLARRGYTWRAIRKLMDAYGLHTYWLRVLPGNEPAIRLYERNGFTITGKTGEFLTMTLEA